MNQTNEPKYLFQVYIRMSSPIDYTPIILAQLTDLQGRVTKQDAVIAALLATVERLSGQTVTVRDTMRTSVPLRSYESRDTSDMRPLRARPQVAGVRPHNPVKGRLPFKPKDSAYPSVSLSDVLSKDERVTIQVGVGKNADGTFSYTSALAIFDGSDLNVTECPLVASLVGMKSSKPGEILYKLIDELKSTGHIKRTFTIAPWKLCSVERDGKTMTLEEVRSHHSESLKASVA
jgi:hypothetical protein